MRLLLLAMLCAGCGQVLDQPAPDPSTPTPSEDDPPARRCNPRGGFGDVALAANLNTDFDEAALSLTADERLAFASTVNGALELARRDAIDEAFGAPAGDDFVVNELNLETGAKFSPSTTADGLLLYYLRDVDGSGLVAVIAARSDADATFPFSAPIALDGAALITASDVRIARGGGALYWTDVTDALLHTADAVDLQTFAGSRVASTMTVRTPVLSADELTLFYGDDSGDILVTTRRTTAGVFAPGRVVSDVNSDAIDVPVAITDDGCVLFFASDRSGGSGVGRDLFEARRAE
jgi:hypothetical protein